MTSVYVGNLPYKLTKEEFIEAFEHFGPIAGATIATKETPHGRVSKGYGFIDFETDAGFEACISSHEEITLDRRIVTYREARPRQTCDDTAFISGLSSDVTPEMFVSMLLPFHPVEYKLIKSGTDERPGFGYAKFLNSSARDIAIEALNGGKLGSSQILVRVADRPFTPERRSFK